MMRRLENPARVILVAMVGTGVASCTTTAPMLPKQFVDLSPAIEPGLVEKQFGPKISQVGFLPEPRFEDLIEDEPGYYSAMTVITMLNHLGSHHDAPRHVSRTGRGSDQVPLDRFYGPARVFDFRSKGRNEPLLPADFQTKTIRPDEIVIAYVGYTPPVDSESLPTYPYLSGEAARYLASLTIKAFGTDMPGQYPNFHCLLLGQHVGCELQFCSENAADLQRLHSTGPTLRSRGCSISPRSSLTSSGPPFGC